MRTLYRAGSRSTLVVVKSCQTEIEFVKLVLTRVHAQAWNSAVTGVAEALQ